MSHLEIRITIIKLLVGLEKSIEHSRESLSAEMRCNQAEIKNALTKMQSKLDVLTARVNEAEERVSDMENILMERKEAEKKGEKQLMDHEGRFQGISDAIKQNNIRIIGGHLGGSVA